MRVVEQAHVNRPPEAVWAVLEDFGGISSWADEVDHSRLTTTQRDGVGAVRRVQIGRNALLERVVEWRPNTALAYAIEGLPVVRSVVNAWTLEAAGPGTEVSLTSTIDANPLVGRVLGQVLAKASRGLLAGLKSHVEEKV